MADRIRDRYAVIGNPIEHSKSPRIHALFAQQTGEVLDYDKLLAPLDGFEPTLREFQASGGKGVNVTLPFKEAAYRLADECSERARQAEAVNTLAFRADGSLYGDNTDGAGLIADLTQHLGLQLTKKRILILGAGGAVRGILGPLLAQQPAHLVIANRTLDKAVRLAEHFSLWGALSGCGYDDLGTERFDLILNGTSSGVSDAVPPIPNGLLLSGAAVYDLFYAAQPTAFMRWGQREGAAVIADGLGMLVEQAAEAFHLWRGKRPDTQAVRRLLRA